MNETVLEQCRRHVLEGANRIVRQEALIAELQCAGASETLPGARALLLTFQSIQRLSEEHLARELAKQTA